MSFVVRPHTDTIVLALLAVSCWACELCLWLTEQTETSHSTLRRSYWVTTSEVHLSLPGHLSLCVCSTEGDSTGRGEIYVLVHDALPGTLVDIFLFHMFCCEMLNANSVTDFVALLMAFTFTRSPMHSPVVLKKKQKKPKSLTACLTFLHSLSDLLMHSVSAGDSRTRSLSLQWPQEAPLFPPLFL